MDVANSQCTGYIMVYWACSRTLIRKGEGLNALRVSVHIAGVRCVVMAQIIGFVKLKNYDSIVLDFPDNENWNDLIILHEILALDIVSSARFTLGSTVYNLTSIFCCCGYEYSCGV